jgi:hypothetical protein
MQEGKLLKEHLEAMASSVTNQQPVLQTRGAVQQLQVELQAMDVRIGLLQHAHLVARLSMAGNSQAAAATSRF